MRKLSPHYDQSSHIWRTWPSCTQRMGKIQWYTDTYISRLLEDDEVREKYTV